jgi:hypothetical protein
MRLVAGPCSIPDNYVWDLWWTKCRRDKFLLGVVRFSPVSIITLTLYSFVHSITHSFIDHQRHVILAIVSDFKQHAYKYYLPSYLTRQFYYYTLIPMGRDSSVGIATRYGLDGPGIESRWGRDFLQPSRPALGPTQTPIQWVPGLFPGGKTAGAWS